MPFMAAVSVQTFSFSTHDPRKHGKYFCSRMATVKRAIFYTEHVHRVPKKSLSYFPIDITRGNKTLGYILGIVYL